MAKESGVKKSTYKVKAYVEVLGVIDAFDVDIEHISEETPTLAIREAKEKIHKQHGKKYGCLVSKLSVSVEEPNL